MKTDRAAEVARRIKPGDPCPTCGRRLPKSVVGKGGLAQAMFAHRAERMLTVRAPAQDCGMDLATYYRVESGRTPELATALRISKWIGRPLEELIDEWKGKWTPPRRAGAKP